MFCEGVAANYGELLGFDHGGKSDARPAMNVEIRAIAPEHIAGFTDAVDVVAREKRYLDFLEGPSLGQAEAFVRDNIARGHPHFVAVSADQQVVGWCDITPKPRPVFAHSGVLGIGLLPGFRGRGIGTALMRHALAAAAAKKLHRIELTVRQDNATAIRLYEKVGFVAEGVHRDAVVIDGAYHNHIFMALLL